jgi:predicted RNA methylase
VPNIQETQDAAGNRSNAERDITVTSPSGMAETSNTGAIGYDEIFNQAAVNHAIPVEILKAFNMVEAGGRLTDNGKTIRPLDKNGKKLSNAVGPMQIIGHYFPQFDADKLANDPQYNVNAAAQILQGYYANTPEKLSDIQRWRLVARKYFGSTDMAKNTEYANKIIAAIGKDSGYKDVLYQGQTLEQPEGITSEETTTNEGQTEQQGQEASLLSSPANFDYLSSEGLPLKKIGDNVYQDHLGDEVEDDYATPANQSEVAQAIDELIARNNEEKQAETQTQEAEIGSELSSSITGRGITGTNDGGISTVLDRLPESDKSTIEPNVSNTSSGLVALDAKNLDSRANKVFSNYQLNKRSSDYPEVNSYLTDYLKNHPEHNLKDAHGMASGNFETLIPLLEKGIDKKRAFHTINVESRGKAQMADRVSDPSPFVLLSKQGGTIAKDGIDTVLLNGGTSFAVDDLSKAFPHINFIDTVTGKESRVAEPTSKESLQVQTSNGQASALSEVTKDLTKITKVHAKVNSKGQNKLIDSGTGYEVFPDKEFKNITAERLYFKAEKAKQASSETDTSITKDIADANNRMPVGFRIQDDKDSLSLWHNDERVTYGISRYNPSELLRQAQLKHDKVNSINQANSTEEDRYSLENTKKALADAEEEYAKQGMVKNAHTRNLVDSLKKRINSMEYPELSAVFPNHPDLPGRIDSVIKINAQDDWKDSLQKIRQVKQQVYKSLLDYGFTAEYAETDAGKAVDALVNKPKVATKDTSIEKEAKKTPQSKVSKNTVFTDEDAEKARAIIRSKLGQLSAGIDPELMQAGITLAGWHIEKGARTFAAYSKAMIDDMGDAIKPYLKSWYMAVKYDPRANNIDGMDDESTVNAEVEKPVTFEQRLLDGESFKTIVQARKALGEFENTKQADEQIELAGVLAARKIVDKGMSVSDTFDALVKLADQMPSLNVRTSTSVEQQAYSTPLPLAYVASIRAGINKETTVLEPSAGNGALLITANPAKVVANELNMDRRDALVTQGFKVYDKDAAKFDFTSTGDYDVIIENPPFGVIKDDNSESVIFTINKDYQTNEIDHAIALNSLKALKDNGKAVLIVGGPAKTLSDAARSNAYNGKAKRAFYYTLYKDYNVIDHFTVSGDLYAKQGAAWPVDVIVIEGRGKSGLTLPAANLPRLINSIEELKNELQTDRTSLQATRKVVDESESTGQKTSDARRRKSVYREQLPGSDQDTNTDGVLSGLGTSTEESGQLTDAGQDVNTATNRTVRTDTNASPVKNKFQAKYTPSSQTNSVDTLVPVNMQASINHALSKLADHQGDIDSYVAKQLNYKQEDLGKYFSAEQVDAIALALDNITQGKGFIIGDQTGVGKGRVNAAMIKYAILNKLTPIFVTEKPNLYGDMIRDLNDIGMNNIKPFATNSGFSIPIDEDAQEWYAAAEKAKEDGETPPKQYGTFIKTPGNSNHTKNMLEMIEASHIKDFDVIFTTYSQMQTVKGETTTRMDFLDKLSQGGLVILDESHNAGGTSVTQKRSKTGPDVGEKTGRAAMARKMVANAKGVFYSSATYAKRPDVLDLYSKTDMGLVADQNTLKDSLIAGGVPLQQAVASMLAKSGQYIRREKSFDGIVYDTVVVDVDRQFAENASEIMRDIMRFDELKQSSLKAMDNELKAEARKISGDKSTGGAGASSTNFTSVMHNMIGQMLLMLKVQPTIDEALTALKRGEKPVITLSNTMGSAIDEYVSDVGLNPGDAIGLNFGDLLKRYLNKSRRVTEGNPFGKKTSRYLTDEELGPTVVRFFKAVEKKIDDRDFTKYPISPIDAIHNALHKEGYKTGEITGRGSVIDYSTDTAIYKKRPSQQRTASGKRKTINDFNNGLIDAIILNQSGATGLSLHSSPKVGGDTRKRHMIVAQPELNIDTHMQMLGRVNRTGQLVLPSYGQLTANIPAEKRPSAILAKKMAMLNANTTAGKESAVKAKDVPDFMNDYGDEIAAQIMNDNREIHRKLGSPLKEASTGAGYETDGAMRKVTGRIPVLSLKDQESLYSTIEDAYDEYIDMLNKTGQNQLEAQAMNLDAKTIESLTVVQPIGGDSPFAEGVNAETVDVKRLGKPYTKEQIDGLIKKVDAQALKETINTAYKSRLAKIDSLPEDDADDIKKKDSARENAKYQAQTLFRMTQYYPSGTPVLLTSPQGLEYVGYVGSFERKGDAKNYFALGNWKLTTYVADAAKQFVLPLSKIKNEEGAWKIETAKAIDVDNALAEGQSSTREKRVILTGNMLSAYSFDKTGQIVNYTTHNKEVKQGVLMPKKFNIVKAVDAKPIVFNSPDLAIDYIKTTFKPDYGVRSSTNEVRIIPQYRGDYILYVPASKAKGGAYYLNKRLVNLLGDFYKRGSDMTVTVEAKNLEETLRILYPLSGAMQPIVKENGKKFMDEKGLKFSKATQKQPGITIAEAKANLPKKVKPMLANGKLKVLHNIGEVDQEVLNRGEVLYHAAWHGSPHEHNKFDSSKIGTGEGAQAFGYGHYFTDARSIAEWYKNKLERIKPATYFVDGENAGNKGDGNWRDVYLQTAIDGTLDEQIASLENALKVVKDDSLIRDLNYAKSLQGKTVTVTEEEPIPGKLYQVELAPTQDEYLDWDKPLSEQSELVKEAILKIKDAKFEDRIAYEELNKRGFNAKDYNGAFEQRKTKVLEALNEHSRGERIYKLIAEHIASNKKEASDYLHSLGIRGIRYKAEQGKSEANNYVIFADEDISITNKYSINAWHGGADFDQFNLNFVGTGRGTSHFGYGFNFSDLKELARDYVGRLGKLYNVDIAPNKSDLLDFDKPVSLQSEKVRTILEDNGLAADNRNGNRIYKDLVAKYGSDKEASTYLLNLGIKGTMHKLPGQTAYNYVAFSDKDVSILQKFATGTMGAEGLYDSKTDTLYLFADNLNNDNFNSVLSHELFHRSLATDPKTKAAYDKFSSELQERFNLAAEGKGTDIENAAYKRVIKAKTKLVNQQEEFAAYIISEWKRAPKTLSAKIIKAIKNFVGAIRMALLRAGLDFGTIGKLHPSDLFAMAGYGTQSNVNIGASFNNEATVMASAPSERFYSALHRAILSDKIPKAAFSTPGMLKQWLSNANNIGKIGVKADEVYWSGINDFLDMKAAAKEKVTREELDSFMRESGTVRTVDVVLGLPEKNEYKVKLEGEDRYGDDNWIVVDGDGKKVYLAASYEDAEQEAEKRNSRLAPPTKYADSNYVVPGGKNAREIVVTIPTVDAYNASDSTHYGDIGTLAGKPELNGKQTMWMRIDDRTDAAGNEGIFMNEGQSQREQHGKKEGFTNTKEVSDLKIKITELEKEFRSTEQYDGLNFNKEIDAKHESIRGELRTARAKLKAVQKVPPAPFITDRNNKASTAYITLLLKKAVSLAIDEGKGFVAWTTGSQQAGFYDLSKQIRRVEWLPQTNTLRAFDLNGAAVIDQVTEENKIEDYVGKEVAKKLLESAPKITGGGKKIHSVEGDGLKIEAPWTAAMYGDESGLDAQGKPSLFTQAANDIAKRFGGKMGSVEIDDGKRRAKGASKVSMKQPALIITPSMAAKIRDEGMPLFSKSENNDIRYSIASEEETNLPNETGVDKFQRQFQDKMIRFKVIQQAKEIESAKNEGYTGNDIYEARVYMKAHGIINPIRDDTDVYQAESLRSGIATELIKDFEETVLQPLVKETVDSKLKMDDISDFLKMQHVEEANARIRKIKPNQDNPTAYGITDEEAQTYLDEVEERDDYQKLKRIAEKWRGLTDDILNMKVSNGIIPQEQANAYRATFNLYVPVKGAEETPQGTGRGLSVYNNNKRRLGHGLREERIVENIIKDYESTINLIEKNKVAIIAGNFIKEIDDESIGTIGKPVRRQVFMPGAMHYMVEYHGSDVQAFDNLHDAQQFVNDESLKVGRNKRDFYIDHTRDDGRVILQAKPLLDDHEFQYYEDGKAIRGQWNDELLARAFKNLGIEPVNKLLEGAREFNTFLSKAYTGWSPTFLIKNPIRDAIQGAITLTSKLGIKETGKIFAAYPHAMKELYNHFKNHGSSSEVNLYRGSGGSTGAAYISDTDRIGNDIMDSYNEYAGAVDTYNRTYEQAIANGDSENKAKLKAAMKAGKAGFRETPVLGHFINFMEKANSITENALRLATFNTLIAERENGKRVYTNAQAALMAKDLMNFNRKGELTTQLGALYLFFNPNAQGTHVLLSALGNSQYKNEARVLTGTIVLAAYLAAEAMRAGEDEDKWKRIPANLKDRNLIFGVGDTKFMLPVPYGYGIFHSLGNAISDVAHGQSGWKSGIRLVASMFDNFSPFGNPIDSEHGAFQLLPTIPKMAMATSVNENNFGSPIMPDKWNASKPDSQTMWRNTKGTVYDDVTQLMNKLSGGSKYKAGLVDVSPESLRFWVSSLTGGTGQFALDSINLGATTLQGATPDLKEIPIVKAFTHEIGVQDARQAFWTAADEAKTAADEFSAAKKAGDRYAMMDIKKSDGTLIALSKFAVKQQKMIKTLRDAQDSIRTSNLSLATKKAKLKALERKEIAVYDKFLHSFYKENY